MNCEYCGVVIHKPRRKFCSHACACSYRKGTIKRRGPNTGITLQKNYNRDRQRMRRGWTDEQIQAHAGEDKYAAARKLGFRSMYESKVYETAKANGHSLSYEPFALPYLVKGNYYPDFVLENGIIVEVKGYFDSRSRAKMIAVKKHNPDLDIRMVFMNSRTKLRKGSKQTYADWCERYCFPYADGMIPLKWFKESHK